MTIKNQPSTINHQVPPAVLQAEINRIQNGGRAKPKRKSRRRGRRLNKDRPRAD